MQFTLDGRPESCPDAFGDDALLHTLRDEFGRNGPRLGCGQGYCGACTIHLDGAAVRSCQLPTAAAAGRSVRTLDGLGDTMGEGVEGLHPVQRAWIAARVPQCGFCQNGQIMTVAARYDQPGPLDADATLQALDSVLCRCGTQPRIRAAVQALATGSGRRHR